ncbi:GNAT family N-acetyltransferase [Oscillatoria sp. FACHB-1407]|nr:GNAT family N-acetyltransferase [Oscillatoria sp. FACHB-1407]
MNAGTLAQHAPDAHWMLIQDDKGITAYCSLWWQNVPTYATPLMKGDRGDQAFAQNQHRLGLIGHYAAQDAESAQLLLNHACNQLAAHSCTLAVAPMDGNTWRRYRLLSDRGTEPIFFLEPDNPDEWCDHFREAGFTSFADYSSGLTTNLTQVDPRMVRVEQRLTEIGVKVRSLNLDNFERELQQIHQLSLISFRNNFLYTPISQTEFISQYSQIKPYVQPQLVLMAEHGDTLVGFLFAIPDLLQAKRGEAINTVIIKTVAVLPGKTYAGLGNLLVSQCQAIAHQLGYTRAIHALMHNANNSRNLSDRYAHTIRRYTLLAKPLAQL